MHSKAIVELIHEHTLGYTMLSVKPGKVVCKCGHESFPELPKDFIHWSSKRYGLFIEEVMLEHQAKVLKDAFENEN